MLRSIVKRKREEEGLTVPERLSVELAQELPRKPSGKHRVRDDPSPHWGLLWDKRGIISRWPKTR